MKIIDQEEVRKAEEQTPEGKKKKMLSKIGTLVFFAVLFIAFYFLDRNHVFSGEPYPIHVANITVIPGETTVQEILQAGYDLSDRDHGEWMSDVGGFYYSEVIDPAAEADPNSYYHLILVKEGTACASITIYNSDEWKSKPLPECRVSKIEVAAFHKESDQAAILDIPLAEVTKEAISEQLGAEPEILDSGRCVWEKGKYSLTLDPDDSTSGRMIISEYVLN